MSCEDILKQRCADDSHDGIYWITLRRSEKLYNHGKNLLFSPYPTNVFALCGRSQHRQNNNNVGQLAVLPSIQQSTICIFCESIINFLPKLRKSCQKENQLPLQQLYKVLLRSLYIRRYYRDRRAIRILLTYKHLQSAWYPSPLTQKLLSPGLRS